MDSSGGWDAALKEHPDKVSEGRQDGRRAFISKPGMEKEAKRQDVSVGNVL